MAKRSYLLSTSDNPWNPWTHFKEWNLWDMEAGYHTLSYLDRIAFSSHEISPADQDLAYEYAVEEILQFNLTGKYIKVPDPGEKISA